MKVNPSLFSMNYVIYCLKIGNSAKKVGWGKEL